MSSESKIKIREIPSEVKIIKEIKKESELEREVEELPENLENVQTSNVFITPILKSEESIQELPREVSPTEPTREEQKLFSESARYSTPNLKLLGERAAQQTTSSSGSIYRTPEQNAARMVTSINPSSSMSRFNSMRAVNEFDSPELKSLRGENQERNYNGAIDLKVEKSRDRLPWET